MILQWSQDWARFSTAETLLVGLLVVLLVAFVEIRPRATQVWERPIRIDDAARERLRASSSARRRACGRISDTLLWTFTVGPFLLALALHAAGITDVAIQVALLSTLAVLAASGANRVATTVAGRPRPYTRVLGEDGQPKRKPDEHPERLRSFFSGHTALTATGGGLLVVFIVQLQLLPMLPMLLAVRLCIAAPIAVALLRVAADRHYLSDVIVGWMVGSLCGAAFPYLVHFT